eukprot:542691_1
MDSASSRLVPVKVPIIRKFHIFNCVSFAISKTKLMLIIIITVALFAIYYFATVSENITTKVSRSENTNPSTKSICQQTYNGCKIISNPICKYILAHPILCQHHHKTGYTLSQKIRLHLASFCGLSHDKSNKHILMKRLTAETTEMNETLSDTNFHTAILLHFMRPPVNTILSGFYYHLQAHEIWLYRKPIENASYGNPRLLNKNLYKDLIESNINYNKKDYYKKYWNVLREIRKCFILPTINDELNAFYDNNITNNSQYKLNSQLTVQNFYRSILGLRTRANYKHRPRVHIDRAHSDNISQTMEWNRFNGFKRLRIRTHHLKRSLHTVSGHSRKRSTRSIETYTSKVSKQIGLFWEFIRYYNCEWSSSYLIDQIGVQFFEHYYRFNLDDFGTHDGFDTNINRLLDGINIIDNDINTQILRNSQSDVSITDERNKLFALMKREDLSGIYERNKEKLNVTKRYFNDRLRLRKMSHVTKGHYNKKEAIENLLTVHEQVCIMLKNMTGLLRFEWKYSEFC